MRKRLSRSRAADAPAVGTDRIELRFPATLAAFRDAFARLGAALDGRALPPATRYGVELVFEEIVANVVRHGAPRSAGAPPAIAVAVDVGADEVALTFDDDGPAFDPCAAGAVGRTRAAALDDEALGGLGLAMVRRAAKSMEYRRTPDARNRLVVRLATGAAAAATGTRD